MGSIVRCRSCGRPLSVPLELAADTAKTDESDGKPFLPRGCCVVSDGEYFTGTEGRYIINLEDARNLNQHSNRSRLNGCCGLDGLDGPNQLCACGAEVATEKSDCWMPHALIFEPGAVELAEQTPGNSALQQPVATVGRRPPSGARS